MKWRFLIVLRLCFNFASFYLQLSGCRIIRPHAYTTVKSEMIISANVHLV